MQIPLSHHLPVVVPLHRLVIRAIILLLNLYHRLRHDLDLDRWLYLDHFIKPVVLHLLDRRSFRLHMLVESVLVLPLLLNLRSVETTNRLLSGHSIILVLRMDQLPHEDCERPLLHRRYWNMSTKRMVILIKNRYRFPDIYPLHPDYAMQVVFDPTL